MAEIREQLKKALDCATAIHANPNIGKSLLAKNEFVQDTFKYARKLGKKQREDIGEYISREDIYVENEDKFLKTQNNYRSTQFLLWDLSPILSIDTPEGGVSSQTFIKSSEKMAEYLLIAYKNLFESINLKPKTARAKLTFNRKKSTKNEFTGKYEEIGIRILQHYFHLIRLIYEYADDKNFVKMLLEEFYLKLSDENEEFQDLNTTSTEDAITQIKLNLKKRNSFKSDEIVQSERVIKGLLQGEISSCFMKIRKRIDDGKLVYDVDSALEKVQNLIKDMNWIISIFFKKDALDCGIENHIIRFENNRSSLSLDLVEKKTDEATGAVEETYYLTKADLQICYETFEVIKMVARGIPKKPKSLIIEELPLKQEKKSLNISVKIDEYNLIEKPPALWENNKIIKIHGITKWKASMSNEISLLNHIKQNSIMELHNCGCVTNNNIIKGLWHIFDKEKDRCKYKRNFSDKIRSEELNDIEFTEVIQNIAYLFDAKSFQDADREWEEFKDHLYQNKSGSAGKAYMEEGESFLDYAERISKLIMHYKPNNYNDADIIAIFHYKCQNGYYLKYGTSHPTCEKFEREYKLTDITINSGKLYLKEKKLPKLSEVVEFYKVVSEQYNVYSRRLGIDQGKNSRKEFTSITDMMKYAKTIEMQMKNLNINNVTQNSLEKGNYNDYDDLVLMVQEIIRKNKVKIYKINTSKYRIQYILDECKIKLRNLNHNNKFYSGTLHIPNRLFRCLLDVIITAVKNDEELCIENNNEKYLPQIKSYKNDYQAMRMAQTYDYGNSELMKKTNQLNYDSDYQAMRMAQTCGYGNSELMRDTNQSNYNQNEIKMANTYNAYGNSVNFNQEQRSIHNERKMENWGSDLIRKKDWGEDYESIQENMRGFGNRNFELPPENMREFENEYEIEPPDNNESIFDDENEIESPDNNESIFVHEENYF